MLGFPGAGKTTAAEIVSGLTDAVHLSSDKFRLAMFKNPKFTPEEHGAVYGALDFLTELLLSKGVSVIYDANLNRYKHRQEKYDICKRTGARPVVLWIQAPKEVARQRATVSATFDPKRPFGNLSASVFDRLVAEIESPRSSEKVVKLDGTRLTPDYIQDGLR